MKIDTIMSGKRIKNGVNVVVHAFIAAISGTSPRDAAHQRQDENPGVPGRVGRLRRDRGIAALGALDAKLAVRVWPSQRTADLRGRLHVRKARSHQLGDLLVALVADLTPDHAARVIRERRPEQRAALFGRSQLVTFALEPRDGLFRLAELAFELRDAAFERLAIAAVVAHGAGSP